MSILSSRHFFFLREKSLRFFYLKKERRSKECHSLFFKKTFRHNRLSSILPFPAIVLERTDDEKKPFQTYFRYARQGWQAGAGLAVGTA
jgi:hypothetical protein